LPYFPALDGVRGIAVAGVLLFHAGFSWMAGGYLGVSTFFTLSGFLITSLLLAERASVGAVRLRTFWLRRFRRLMPAALACLVLVLLFGVFVADTVQRESLAGDVIAALAYVANWRFILEGQSYADLFAAGESPVLHFWSLAIEEQFYLVYPLVLGLILGLSAMARRSRNDRQRFWLTGIGRRYRALAAVMLVTAIGGSLALTLFAGFSDDHIYLGSGTRAAELLIGGLLAVVLFNAKVTGRLAQPGRAQRVTWLVGSAALIATIALWVSAEQTSSWLYHGGLTAYALLSAAVITAAILPTGPVAWVLALAPIRHLGRISYGVYLYHWPVFLALRQEADLDTWRLLLIGGAITLVLAELSFFLLEMPIRRGQRLVRMRPIRIAPVAVVAIAVAAVILTTTAPPPDVDFDATRDRLSALSAQPDSLPSTTVDPAALVPPTPRIAPFGDSTALQTAWGVALFMEGTQKGVMVDGHQGLGCSVMRTELRRYPGRAGEPALRDCNDWERIWKGYVDEGQPDLALVQVGPWEILDRQLPGEQLWRSPGDPVFDDFLLSEMTTAVDVLSSNGSIVVWLTSPLPGDAYVQRERASNWDPVARMASVNALIRRLPQERPGRVVVVDLAEWIAGLPPGEDARLRPDGIHFENKIDNDTSSEVADTYLGEAVLSAWSEQWKANRRAELAAGPPLPLVVLGDQTARQIGDALSSWTGDGSRFTVENAATSSCGVGAGGARLMRTAPEPVPADCDLLKKRAFDSIYASSARTVLVHTSLWDVVDRELPGQPGWRSLGDPAYDDYLRATISDFLDYLQGQSVRVVWLLTPHIDIDRVPGEPSKEYSSSDPRRIDRLNELINEAAATRPFVTVLDYAAFARGWPGGEFDEQLRPNGVTPSDEGADTIAEWLGPQLAELAEQPPTPSPRPSEG
jgi:peptidoglycan/LPS O-acetylase OafA/YrhL